MMKWIIGAIAIIALLVLGWALNRDVFNKNPDREPENYHECKSTKGKSHPKRG